MSRRPTWKWAHGNKRQKKVAALSVTVCGCAYCCPEDRRQKLRARMAEAEQEAEMR